MKTTSVGAITADEVEFAGGKNENNTSYYLNAGTNYWTMTPGNRDGTWANVFYVNASGSLSGNGVSLAFGLRPVINLAPDTLFNQAGNGTSNSPYVVQ